MAARMRKNNNIPEILLLLNSLSEKVLIKSNQVTININFILKNKVTYSNCSNALQRTRNDFIATITKLNIFLYEAHPVSSNY